jgi:hypothetical protein
MKGLAMSKIQLDPTEKTDLFAYLEAILGCVKTLHASLGAVMADVVAIRNTVFDNPEEMAFYRKNLMMTLATAKPMVEEAMHSYDDLLEEIVESQQYQN